MRVYQRNEQQQGVISTKTGINFFQIHVLQSCVALLCCQLL